MATRRACQLSPPAGQLSRKVCQLVARGCLQTPKGGGARAFACQGSGPKSLINRGFLPKSGPARLATAEIIPNRSRTIIPGAVARQPASLALPPTLRIRSQLRSQAIFFRFFKKDLPSSRIFICDGAKVSGADYDIQTRKQTLHVSGGPVRLRPQPCGVPAAQSVCRHRNESFKAQARQQGRVCRGDRNV